MKEEWPHAMVGPGLRTSGPTVENVGVPLLKDHVEHGVRESIEDSGKADAKVGESATAVGRFPQA
jgi:hypothetical protein